MKKILNSICKIVYLKDNRSSDSVYKRSTKRELLKKILSVLRKDLGIFYLKQFLKKIHNRYNPKYLQIDFNSIKEKDGTKIVGLIITWNNFEFFQFALKQALDFCDEVLLIEGGHSMTFPQKSIDGTVEYINKMKGHPKLRIFDFKFREKYKRYDIVQLFVRMGALKKSRFLKPGNWLILWDDDMFFFDEELKRIKELMSNTDYDVISVNERRFIYNFRFNTFAIEKKKIYSGGWAGWQFNKIYEGAYIRGYLGKQVNPRFYYKDGKPYSKYLYLDDVVCFHYPYVKLLERIKARWLYSIEKGTVESRGKYDKFMSVKWTNDEDIYKFKEVIENINNEKGFNVYTGKHPEILDSHPWRNIDDVRKM